jgi:lipoprotein-anchoring transpeptidase ErfK/SrfK
VSYDEPGVRRGPVIALLAAATIVLCAVLGMTGVLQTPAARASAAALVPDPMTVAIDDLVSVSQQIVSTLEQPAEDDARLDPIDQAAVPKGEPAGLYPDALPTDSGSGRRVVYSINRQRVWLVESDGSVSRTYPVSGRLDRPGPGEYEVYSRSPDAISYTGDERMRYMIRFAHGERAAIGFHDIPVDETGAAVQTVDQLGEPLSAGCIRQSEEDAQVLWDWAPVGTKVVVVA